MGAWVSASGNHEPDPRKLEMGELLSVTFQNGKIRWKPMKAFLMETMLTMEVPTGETVLPMRRHMAEAPIM